MSLTFLPWVRSASAAAATAPTSGYRPDLALKLEVNGTSVYPATQQLSLLGPGDAVGFDPAQVIRTDPTSGAAGFESERFATIEFDHPALPWLLSPGQPTNNRLTPWLCLVVVDDVPGMTLGPGVRAGSLVLDISADVDASTQLSDPANAWAWAHAQVAGTLDADLQTIDDTTGERTLSRLICPRPLTADRRYLACVVPTFEAGRLAGLGKDPDSSAAVWAVSAAISLPVYFSWTFSTGDSGDFLDLAGRLTARTVADLGGAELDLSDSGLISDGQPIAATIDLPGALVAASAATAEAIGTDVRAALAEALAPAAGALPSPCYGAAYTGLSTVSTDMRGWAAELNLDPRWRVAAALGTAVVQAKQADLVAASWDQADDAATVNVTLDRARLARATTSALVNAHLATVDPTTLARVSAPAHAGLLSETIVGSTVHAALARDDPARTALLSPSFRRLHARTVTSGTQAAPTSDPALNSQLQMQLLQQLDGEVTVTARASSRLTITAAAPTSAPGSDLLQRVLVAPSFATPMVDALIQTDPELMLPGVTTVPADSVVLLATNPAFVAAYLIGLNTELGRELTWQKFPVDRTATYFRWFWDYRGQAPATPDLAPLDRVDAESSLGALVQARAQVVLLIRSELFRRYPNTLLYAVPTQTNGSGPALDDPSVERLPMFAGTLDVDLSYVGFDLTPDQALGRDGRPGWFFVLQQQLTQASFGTAVSDPLQEATSAAVASACLRPAVRVVLDAARLVGAPA